ncbi:BTAD domain-containing putative transcriptional regulator [Streptomyces microflavus]|uniref:BTAD domain-containing putative transcriptional regulator n=1 Tax=Streptomyces microflavus TaxID=1919 RepID=UPI003681A7BC
MRFKVLGSLEVLSDDEQVVIRGVQQRSLLGMLLLRADSVVSTGEIMATLWGADRPATARKMVQNSVAGLRRTFHRAATAEDAADRVVLKTALPGYLLQINREQLDLTQFHELVTLGRARLAACDWDAASRLLRQALALWRGPALADVVDSGITWPELTALRGNRLAVHEDCIQAELALDRDRELIGELETLLEAEPTRERLVAQLMVALYNCGRQPEALARYRRTRDLLAHRFGLEPGHDLQRLQHAILSHDPALALRFAGAGPATPAPSARVPVPVGPIGPTPGAPRSAVPMPLRRPIRATEPAPPTAPAPAVPPDAQPVAEEPRPYRAPWERVECRRVSIVMVRAGWPTARAGAALAPGRVDRAVKELTASIQEQAAPYRGLVRRAFGAEWMVIFGVPRAREDDPERAVRAAFALRRRLAAFAERPGTEDDERLASQFVIGTGEVIVTYDDSGREPMEVTGEVLDSCRRTLLQAPPGEVWASEATADAVGSLFGFAAEAGLPGILRLTTERPRPVPDLAEPSFLERTRELNVLHGAYQDALRRRLPHLVTVVGEPGIGKTRLIGEFTASLLTADQEDAEATPRVLYAGAPTFDAHTPYEPLAGLVRGCVGIRPGAAGATVLPALASAVTRLLPDEPAVARVVAALAACLGLPTPAASPEGPGGGHEAVDREEILDAVRRILEETAAERPLVAVLDDFHRAAAFVQDFVEDLTVRLGPVSLLLAVGARSELLHDSPGWGCAKRRSVRLNLAPLSTSATSALIEVVSGRLQNADRDRAALADGNPLFAQQYARTTMAGGLPHLVHPPTVRAIATAQLDTVDDTAKSVLRDAAVVGETLWRSAVGAVSLRDSDDLARTLEYLESRDLLRRVHRSSVPGDIEYAFRYPVTRDVVLAQLPARVLVERHLRAARWAALLDAVRPDLLARYYDRAIALAEADGAQVEKLERQAWEALVAACARAASAGDDQQAVRCLDYALDRCPPGEPERTWMLTHRARILDNLAGRPPGPDTGRQREARRLSGTPAARCPG